MNTALGTSITKAYRLMVSVYADIATLVKEVDRQLSLGGWAPFTRTVSSSLSNRGLDADQWILPALYRLYAPTRSKSSSRSRVSRLLALVIIIDPAGVRDEPDCVLIAARYNKPKDGEKIWDDMDAGDTGLAGTDELCASIRKQIGPHVVSNNLLQRDLLPGAEEAIALRVNLCDLTDARAVTSKLVEPLLKASQELFA